MTHTQLLNAQTNAEETKTQSNSEIITYDKIENTPFTMVKQDNMYMLTMGQYRLSEPFEYKDELIDWMHENTFNLTLSIAMIVHENMEGYKNNTK